MPIIVFRVGVMDYTPTENVRSSVQVGQKELINEDSFFNLDSFDGKMSRSKPAFDSSANRRPPNRYGCCQYSANVPLRFDQDDQRQPCKDR